VTRVTGPLESRIGIDLGTTHTVAALAGADGRSQPLLFDASFLLPSAVYAETDGRLLVGRDAERSAKLDPTRFEPNPKRRIDDGTVLLGSREYPVADLLSAVLRRAGDEASRVAGAMPARTVLTYPAHWAARRKSVLADAAARAGLPAVTLVPEPIAAAMYFTTILGRTVPPGAALVVYDFGGGTFDTTVLRRRPDAGWDVLISDGLNDVGGVDLDAAVIEHMEHTLGAQNPDQWRRLTAPADDNDRRRHRMLWEEVRAAKEQLSRSSSAAIHVPLFDTDFYLTREEFERVARPYIERTVDLTVTALQRAGVRHDQIAGLFPVGGSSRIPLANTMLHHRVGVASTLIEQPELVVALGSVLALGGPMPPMAPPRPMSSPLTPPNAMPPAPMPAPMPAVPVTPMPPIPVSPMGAPAGPVSAPPVSGGPVSGMPVSPSPVSSPVSSAPMSAPPVSGPPTGDPDQTVALGAAAPPLGPKPPTMSPNRNATTAFGAPPPMPGPSAAPAPVVVEQRRGRRTGLLVGLVVLALLVLGGGTALAWTAVSSRGGDKTRNAADTSGAGSGSTQNTKNSGGTTGAGNAKAGAQKQTVTVNKTVWYAGLKLTFGQLEFDRSKTSQPLVAHVLMENLGPKDVDPDLDILFNVDNQHYDGYVQNRTQVASGQKSNINFGFDTADFAGSIAGGSFTIGKGDVAQAVVPVTGGTLVAYEPKNLLGPTDVKFRDLHLAIKTCDLRGGFTDFHGQAAKGHLAITCTFDAQYTGDSAAGHYFGEENMKLALPDGTEIGTTVSANEALYGAAVHPDVYIGFEVPAPVTGKYILRLVDVHGGETRSATSVYEIPLNPPTP
jgi:hypothetical protein